MLSHVPKVFPRNRWKTGEPSRLHRRRQTSTKLPTLSIETGRTFSRNPITPLDHRTWTLLLLQYRAPKIRRIQLRDRVSRVVGERIGGAGATTVATVVMILLLDSSRRGGPTGHRRRGMPLSRSNGVTPITRSVVRVLQPGPIHSRRWTSRGFRPPAPSTPRSI